MLKPTVLAAWSRVSSRNVDDRRQVLAFDDAVADAAEDERGRGDNAGAARQPDADEPDPAALQEPPETGCWHRFNDVLRTRRRTQHGAAGRRAGTQPRDPDQRLSDASSTIHRTSSSNEMPACAASSGTSDVSVMPGCVLTSRQTSPSVPSRRSS